MTSMPHLPLMQWDYHDQLAGDRRSRWSTIGGTPETTYYVYDAAGQRVRKVTERQAASDGTPTRKNERIYLGGFEVYREYGGDGTAITLERETLHVMDDKQRVALVETRTQGDDGSPAQLTRYQFGNHLGSASLELDETGRIISYEEYLPVRQHVVPGRAQHRPRRRRSGIATRRRSGTRKRAWRTTRRGTTRPGLAGGPLVIQTNDFIRTAMSRIVPSCCQIRQVEHHFFLQ